MKHGIAVKKCISKEIGFDEENSHDSDQAIKELVRYPSGKRRI